MTHRVGLSVRYLWMVAAAAATALAAGCADPAADGGNAVVPAVAGDELTGRTFLSESVTRDGVAAELVAGTRIEFFFPGLGALQVQAGCNILLVDLGIDADRLLVDSVGTTDMGCEPELHAQDEWLAELLRGSPTWRLDGDTLTLTDGATTLTLVDRRVADPDRPLAGTRWLIDTVVSPAAASSLPAAAEGTAWLLIEGETFQASTGCRDLSGRVSVEGGRISFHDVVQTDLVCADELAGIDEVIRTVLSSSVEFTVEADRLRLDHPEGLGLSLRAEG